ALDNRRPKRKLPGDRSHRRGEGALKRLVIDLLHLFNAGQTSGKFVDVDQEVPCFVHRDIEIDFTVKNHCRWLSSKTYARSYVRKIDLTRPSGLLSLMSLCRSINGSRETPIRRGMERR